MSATKRPVHPIAELFPMMTDDELADLAAEKRELDDWLASPDAYVDEARERLKDTLARQGDLTWRLARAEASWLQLQTALEQLEGD